MDLVENERNEIAIHDDNDNDNEEAEEEITPSYAQYEKVIAAIQSTVHVNKSILICDCERDVCELLHLLTEHDYPCTDCVDELYDQRILIITLENLHACIDYIEWNDVTAIYSLIPIEDPLKLDYISKLIELHKIGLWVFL